MRRLALMVLPLSLIACASEQQQPDAQPQTRAIEPVSTQMEVSRSNARRSARGPADWFTGDVTLTPLFDPKGPSQVGAARVRFEPRARTAWHKHPLGQRLVVLEGIGWTQVEGGPIETIRAGDVVWCPPDVRHWHGATPNTAMTHMAIQEAQNGSPVTWLEHVTEEQYLAGAEIERSKK
jgi:quercetin dioxygenase-like cupin family protein